MRVMLAFLETLKECTDKEQPMGQQQIIKKLQERYGEEMSEELSGKKIRNRMKAFLEFEEHLPDEEKTVCYRVYKGRKTDYYYQNALTDCELKFLVDSILSSMIFDSETADDFVRRLYKLGGKKLKKMTPYANTSCYGKQRFCLKHDVLENVKNIDEAIQRGVFISFRWNVYSIVDGEVAITYQGERTVKPLKLFLNQGRYYLLCRHLDSAKIYTYSVDLMEDIQVMPDIHDKLGNRDIEQNFNYASYILEHPFQMGGEVMRYKLRVQKEYLSRVVDAFSYEIKPIPNTETESTIDISLKASREGMKYWLLKNYDVAELIDSKDEELKRALSDAVKKLYERYK